MTQQKDGHGLQGGHGHGPGAAGGAAHGRDRFKNPKHFSAYLARLLARSRDAWQKPDRVVRALGIVPGSVVGEIGAGPGYFTGRLAKAAGRAGRVYAADPVPAMLERLRARMRSRRVGNVTPVLCESDDPMLPLRSCDLLFMVNVFHHVPRPARYLRALGRFLRPGGRVVIIEFQRRDLPVGPPVEEKIGRASFLRIVRNAGYKAAREHMFLPYQFMFELWGSGTRATGK